MSYKRKGVGTYENSGDWTWQHFPPPFTMWGPQNPSSQPSSVLAGGGLGCAQGGCGCGCSENAGLGQTGLLGTGLFSSADPTTWGIGEAVTILGGGYVAFSMVDDVLTVGTKTKKSYKRATKSAGAGSIGTILLLGALAYGAYYFYQKSQGLGDYQHQGFVNPQILKDPTRSAEILIPDGWGGGGGCGCS